MVVIPPRSRPWCARTKRSSGSNYSRSKLVNREAGTAASAASPSFGTLSRAIRVSSARGGPYRLKLLNIAIRVNYCCRCTGRPRSPGGRREGAHINCLHLSRACWVSNGILGASGASLLLSLSLSLSLSPFLISCRTLFFLSLAPIYRGPLVAPPVESATHPHYFKLFFHRRHSRSTPERSRPAANLPCEFVIKNSKRNARSRQFFA